MGGSRLSQRKASFVLPLKRDIIPCSFAGHDCVGGSRCLGSHGDNSFSLLELLQQHGRSHYALSKASEFRVSACCCLEPPTQTPTYLRSFEVCRSWDTLKHKIS